MKEKIAKAEKQDRTALSEKFEKSDKKEFDRKNLEIVLEKKVKPLIKDATERFLGVNIDKLNEDITSTLTKSSIGDIKINYSLKYKQAKKQYKKDFLSRILILHLGNISEAAKLLGLDRRTLHRLINEFKIDIKKIKYELLKPYNIKIHALSEAIEDVLENYKTIIHPKKLEEMYKNVPILSEDIIKDLPEPELDIKDAEELFEKEYFKYHLEKNHHNISKTAKNVGIRFETLHRKMKKLGVV